MTDKIIDFCIKNKFFVILLAIAVVIWGIWSINNIPLDALPDLSDTQVIIYSKWDRPPQLIEDQVTYPIVSSLLGAPKVKDIRAFSDYGFSYVYVIFEDNVDVYWARSRVMEYLSKVIPSLPEGVKLELGPDATGIGWIYEYALVDESGKNSLADLRSFQDWYLKYILQSVKGVAEVASVGGFVKQYQILVNQDKLIAYGIPVTDIIMRVKESNQEMGARLLEFTGREYMLTVKGYISKKEDIENIVIKNINGIPVKIKDVANVQIGPEIRRGVAELDGKGEVVGGIVIMRYKENALKVIQRVKEKLTNVKLPEGVKLVTTYDRSILIEESIKTLRKKVIEQMLVVAIVIILFLLHISSSMVPIIALPIAVIVSFIPLYFMRLTSNIMSLGGISLAIGAMVDASIVVVENVHKRLGDLASDGINDNYKITVIDAIKEVARSSFYSLLVMAVAFIPIFTLEGFEGRLFKPLAFTNNLSMFFSAILSVTLVPVITVIVIRTVKFDFNPKWLSNFLNFIFIGKIHKEEDHPVSSFIFRIYTPAVKSTLKKPYLIVIIALFISILTIPFFFMIGKEFMPPLNEGTLLFMPTTLPGISITEATKIVQIQDKIIRSFPEVETVFGKVGRAETSTDPAPFSMMETTIVLKPQREWRKKERWYSKIVPEFLKAPLRIFWPEIITVEELISEMDKKLQLPGIINSWTFPIKGRIDMLTTGVRTVVGVKLYGNNLQQIEKIGNEIEKKIIKIKGTRSVFSEKTGGGFFVNFKIKREELARHGLTVEEVNMLISSVLGGENITYTIEGRERYPVNIRYPRELRDNISKIKNIVIPVKVNSGFNKAMGGMSDNLSVKNESNSFIRLSQIVDIEVAIGPSMIRNENGMLAGYIFIDVGDRDIGSYVNEIKKIIKKNIKLPNGYYYTISGQYEFMERVKERMLFVIPLTSLLIFILIYFSTRSYTKTFIILLMEIPSSLVGVIWALLILQYNISLGVWCGIVALLGLDAETGMFLQLFLDLSYDKRKNEDKINSISDIREAVLEGTVNRIRPRIMTVGTTFIGLLPIMLSQTYEVGSDLMKRIAAPMAAGVFSSFLVELFVYPAFYFIWRSYEFKKQNRVQS